LNKLKNKTPSDAAFTASLGVLSGKILSVVLQIVYKVFAGFGGIDRVTGSKIKA
jgi:hypothetical protein